MDIAGADTGGFAALVRSRDFKKITTMRQGIAGNGRSAARFFCRKENENEASR
jgi:hypothetical protein